MFKCGGCLLLYRLTCLLPPPPHQPLTSLMGVVVAGIRDALGICGLLRDENGGLGESFICGGHPSLLLRPCSAPCHVPARAVAHYALVTGASAAGTGAAGAVLELVAVASGVTWSAAGAAAALAPACCPPAPSARFALGLLPLEHPSRHGKHGGGQAISLVCKLWPQTISPPVLYNIYISMNIITSYSTKQQQGPCRGLD